MCCFFKLLNQWRGGNQRSCNIAIDRLKLSCCLSISFNYPFTVINRLISLSEATFFEMKFATQEVQSPFFAPCPIKLINKEINLYKIQLYNSIMIEMTSCPSSVFTIWTKKHP